jgi:4-amino-4-deoxy-L-arabinose transferase-like glycosyltransferase
MSKNMAVCLCAFILFLILYTWNLGTLTPGLSPHENTARTASGSFRTIIDNPLNAPHKIPQYVLQLLGYHGAFLMRLVSVIFALLFIICLYLLLRSQFGKYAATAGTLLFGATPWVVLTARNASPDIMMMSSLLLMYSYLLFEQRGKYLSAKWFFFILSLAICIYTPGLIWFLIFAATLYFKRISNKILTVERFVAVMGIAVLIIVIAPLAYAGVQDSAIIKDWLGLPKQLPNIVSFINNTWNSLMSLVYQMSEATDYTLGKFAILSVVQVVLGSIGIIALWKKNTKQVIAVLGLLVVGILVSGISDSLIFLTICLPATAIFCAEGLIYLYGKWFSFFPRNPLAKWFALTLVTLVLVGQLSYGARYVLLAWPHNMETRKLYVIQ